MDGDQFCDKPSSNPRPSLSRCCATCRDRDKTGTPTLTTHPHHPSLPSLLTLHPLPSPLTRHPLPSPLTLTTHPYHSPSCSPLTTHTHAPTTTTTTTHTDPYHQPSPPTLTTHPTPYPHQLGGIRHSSKHGRHHHPALPKRAIVGAAMGVHHSGVLW